MCATPDNFSQLKRVCRTQTLTSTEHHLFQVTLTFLGPPKRWKSIPAARQKPEILAFLYHQYRNNSASEAKLTNRRENFKISNEISNENKYSLENRKR